MLRYFSRQMSNPDSDLYGKLMSLHRRIDLTGATILERWDRTVGAWVDHPQLLDHTGEGGADADDYTQIAPEQAIGLLIEWGIDAETANQIIAEGEQLSASDGVPLNVVLRIARDSREGDGNNTDEPDVTRDDVATAIERLVTDYPELLTE